MARLRKFMAAFTAFPLFPGLPRSVIIQSVFCNRGFARGTAAVKQQHGLKPVKGEKMNKLHKFRNSAAFAALLSGSVLLANPGQAQQIEEILITSQKKASATDVQSVPSAITAFDDRVIERTFALDMTDLGRLAPNTQLNPSGTFMGFANYFIRGVGQSNTVRTVDPAVGAFMDGIYIGFGPASIATAFDLATVEVLRGPQGTLFGKNVTGGAVSVTSKRPTNEFGGYVKATYGRFDRVDIQGAINVPLVEDNLAIRLAGLTRTQNGYFKNELLDLTKPETDIAILRPSIRWTPNEDVDITLIGEYYRDRGGSSASQNLNSNINPRLVGAAQTPVPAIVQSVFGYIPPDDKYEVNHNLQGYVDAEAYHFVLDANYDLGHGTATLITGYRDVTYNTSTDFDGSPFTVFHFPDNRESQNQFSAELRYASSFSDWMEFTVGLYYFTQEFEIGERRQFFGGGTPDNPIEITSAGLAFTDDESYAIFGQGSVDLTPDVSLIIGGRYTYEEKQITLCPFNAAVFDSLSLGDCPTVLNADDDWSSFAPKVGIDWHGSDDILLYGSWSKGFRSGSFNSRAPFAEALGPVDEETVSAFEVGMKGLFLDRRLRFNVAGFLSDYKDIQRTVSDTVIVNGVAQVLQIPRNAAEATIWGIEIETQYVAADGLTLDASIGYLNAEYDEFNNIDANRNGVFEPEIDPQIAKELEFERVPEWEFTVGATYEMAVTDRSNLRLRTSYGWRDSHFVDTLNSPSVAVDSYGLLDASVTYDDYVGGWELSLFGRNLTNEKFHDFGFDGGTHRAVWGGVPRTWGIELKAAF
ncbi:MAG: TonB-dependent receptor [Alphaproteobacteria bacterium]|nr:MAG: TonB-dependent receptor [Alphaproteobacteria bacterium]